MNYRKRQVKRGEVDRWAQEARLDLPDRWQVIRGRLELPQPAIRATAAHRPAVQTRRRWVLAANGILLVVLAITLLSILDRPGFPASTTSAATYSASATKVGMTAGTTSAATTASVPGIGNLLLFHEATSLSDDPGVTVHRTQIDLQMEGKYLPQILGVDSHWNLLVRTYLEDGVGYTPDLAVPTYEFGLYDLREKTYRRLFRIDARSDTIPDWPSQYAVYTDPAWDGEHVVYARCVHMQTVQTHANLNIYTVSTGKTATYLLDKTLNDHFDADDVSVSQVRLLDGKMYFFAAVMHDKDQSLNHRAIYRLDTETGECVRIMTVEYGGILVNLSGRIAWIADGLLRYIEEPAVSVAIEFPESAPNEVFWDPDRYAFTTNGAWKDSTGVTHVPESDNPASQFIIWTYREGVFAPLAGITDGGARCWMAGDYLVARVSQGDNRDVFSYIVYNMSGDRLVTLDGLPGDLSTTLTADNKLALVGPYGRDAIARRSREWHREPLDGRLVADVYWIDLNDLK